MIFKITYGILVCAFLLSQDLYASSFSLKSSVIKPNQTFSEDQVFNGFGCTGKNVSPDLEWSNAPKGTKAFAVTMYDPDAPTGSGWWHWVAFNIPANVTHLKLNAGDPNSKHLPKGTIQGRTDFGKSGYGGPCPPPGDKPHRYFIRVYALKDKLPLDADTPAAQVGYYLNQMKLAEAEILAMYGR